MREICALLIVLLAAVPLAEAKSTDWTVSFAVPGQAAGTIGVSEADWMVVVSYPADSFSANVSSTKESFHTDHEVRRAFLDTYGFNGPQQEELPPTSETVPAFDAAASSAGAPSSMWVEGALDIDLANAQVLIQPYSSGDCLMGFNLDEQMTNYEARYDRLCLAGDGGFLAVRPLDGTSQLGFQLRSDDVRLWEWQGLDIDCSGNGYCPPDNVPESQTHTAPETILTVEKRNYHRFENTQANVSASGQVSLILLGGSSINALIDGWLRLPAASGLGGCDSCPLDGDSTLQAEGVLSLTDVRPSQDGRMESRVGGTAFAARLDEATIPPELLWGTTATVGAAAAAAVAVALKFLLSALFTRRADKDPLKPAKRRAVYEYVVANPGTNFREVARQTGVAAGTVRHHLTMLVRFGLLVEHGHGFTRRFFDAKRANGDWRSQVVLREPPLRQLHDWLVQNPRATQRAVLEAMATQGWSRSTTQHRLTRLCDEGLVESQMEGRFKRYKVLDSFRANVTTTATRAAPVGA